MPFPTQTARAFTRANVEALNPGQYGCLAKNIPFPCHRTFRLDD